MGKHYEISGNELKILSKYLQDYADAPFKSSRRNDIVNQATRELSDAGFARWDHKKVVIYFNNNKKNAEKQSNPQNTPNLIFKIDKPVNSQMQQASQFVAIKMQENPTKDNSQQPIFQVTPSFDQPKITPQAQINQSQVTKSISLPSDSFLNSFQSPIAPPKQQALSTPLKDDLKLTISPSQKVDKEVENKNQPKISAITISSNDDIICPQSSIFSEDQSQNFDVDSQSSLKSDDENQFKIIQPFSRNNSDIYIPYTTHISSFNEKTNKDDNSNNYGDSKSCFKTQNPLSESSDTNNFKSVSFDTQEDQYSEMSESCSQSEFMINPLNLEDLSNQLLKLRDVSADNFIDQKKYDMLNFDINQKLQKIIEINHKSALIDSEVSERFQFQKKLEKKFTRALKELEGLLKTPNIYSYDSKIQTINAPNIYRCVSNTTRQYNNEVISPVHSRHNSQVLSNESDDSIITAIDFADQDFIKEKYLNELAVRPHKPFHLQNQKLENLYNGKFDKSKTKFDIYENSEVSVIVSYHINKTSTVDNDNDLCVCEIAYISNHFKKNSFILHFNFKNYVIESFEKVFAMYFYRHENVNKIFVCGQKSVKELTIIGFDEFIQNENEDFEIVETNSFSFDNNNPGPKYAVITVWDDELVLGFGTSLYFWKLEKVKSIQNKYSFKANAKKLNCITSLCVIENSTNQSCLAVASYQYPVIFIFNKNHEKISRLVSHTMGITSLKRLGNSLFSGSLDMNVRIWNIEKGVPEISFNSHCKRIKTIEIGFYFDNYFLFLADENGIQCFNITKKIFLFAIPLAGYVIPKQMVFLTGKNNDSTDYARLVLLMEFYKDAYVPSSKTSDVMLTIEFV